MTNTTNDAAAYAVSLPAHYDDWMLAARETDHAYALAVARAPFYTIAKELIGAEECPECDCIPSDEGTQTEHGMIGDYVIIGCMGYHTIRSVADNMPK
jgi:hypothetical protein